MSLSGLFTRPTTIVQRGPESDEFYSEVTETLVETVCELQQRTRDEQAGDLSQTTWDCFLPSGTDLSQADAVIVDGDEFEVVGEPWSADSGSAAVHHVYALLRRAQGVSVS